MVDYVNAVVQGIMVGGLYAMFATGLALMFGVMKLVNIAHGDLIVLAAYIGLVVTQTLGLGPLAALVVVIPIMALVGYGLQRGLFNRTMGGDIDAAAAGLVRPLDHHRRTASSRCSRPTASACRPAPSKWRAEAQRRDQRRRAAAEHLVAAILVIAALQSLLYRTALGRAFRAVVGRSQDGAADGPRQPPRVRRWRWRLSLAIVAARRRVARRSAPISTRRPGRRA